MDDQDDLIDVAIAACVLNTPERWVMGLLDSGALSFIKKGETKLLSLKRVLEYKNGRDALRRETLRQLTEMSQEFGGYELTGDENVDDESSS